MPKRTHGILVKWNDERGFGFIDPAVGGAQVFVHVRAFPRDGVRPDIGERVSFEMEVGEDGKRRAFRVLRPGTTHRPQRSAGRSNRNTQQRSAVSIGGALLLAAVLAYVYLSQRKPAPAASNPTVTSIVPATSAYPLFYCDGRTKCAQMTSCAEATYFLDHCPDTIMDSDHDGVPCQSQWCGASHSDWP